MSSGLRAVLLREIRRRNVAAVERCLLLRYLTQCDLLFARGTKIVFTNFAHTHTYVRTETHTKVIVVDFRTTKLDLIVCVSHTFDERFAFIYIRITRIYGLARNIIKRVSNENDELLI